MLRGRVSCILAVWFSIIRFQVAFFPTWLRHALRFRLIPALKTVGLKLIREPHLIMNVIAPSWMLRYGSRDPRDTTKGGDVFKLSIPLALALFCHTHWMADGRFLFDTLPFFQGNSILSIEEGLMEALLSLVNAGSITIAAIITVMVGGIVIYAKLKVRRLKYQALQLSKRNL